MLMNNDSTLIRISKLNKILLDKYISVNFKNEYQFKEKYSVNDLITFLIVKNVGIFYPKIKQEALNELSKFNK